MKTDIEIASEAMDVPIIPNDNNPTFVVSLDEVLSALSLARQDERTALKEVEGDEFKVTLPELRKIFLLSERSDRHLMKNLENKIKVTSDNDIEVTDEETKRIVREFRNGGSMDADGMAKLYNVPKSTIMTMAQEKSIPCYRLINERGSKLLFLKSEISKHKEVILERSRVGNFKTLYRICWAFINGLHDMRKTEADILYKIGVESKTIEEVSRELDMMRERVRQIFNVATKKAIQGMRFYIQYYKSNEEFRIKYDELIKENLELKNKLEFELKNRLDFTTERISGGKVRIVDLDISFRLRNCLLASNIETLDQLFEYSINDIRRWKNFGSHTLRELKDLLHEYKIYIRN